MINRFLGWVQLLFLLQLPFLLHAQQAKEPKFGKISPEELSMKVYEKDSSAQAVVLSDITDVSFRFVSGQVPGNKQGGYEMVKAIVRQELVYRRHVRIKILGKQGYEAANIEIPVYAVKGDQLKSLKGVTYNVEMGKTIETDLQRKQVFTQKNGYRTTYKFAMPQVKEGAVLEYAYELTTEVGDLQPWVFQNVYPVLHAAYRVEVPKELDYQYFVHGKHALEFDVVDEGQEMYKVFNEMQSMRTMKGRWEARNVPAIRQEPLMVPVQTLLGRVDFSLRGSKWSTNPMYSFSASWQQFEEHALGLSEEFGGYLSDAALAPMAQQIMQASPDTLQRIRLAIEQIGTRIRWDGEHNISAASSLGATLRKGEGNSASLNLAVINLLRAMGIPAFPMLVSRRGLPELQAEFPSPYALSDVVVIAHIGGRYLPFDATAKLPIGFLPPSLLNGQGRLYGGSVSDWLDTTPSKASMHRISGDFQLQEDGSLQGKVSHALDGYVAYTWRDDRRQVDEQMRGSQAKIEHVEWTNADSVYMPLGVKYDLSLPVGEQVQVSGNRIDIHPMLSYMDGWDLFKLPTREYAVDLRYPRQYHYVMSFKLPAGYQPAQQVPSFQLSMPNKAARCVCHTSFEEGTLMAYVQLQLNKTRYTPAEYAALREFAIRVSAKLQEMVSLQKMGEQ